MFRLIGFNSSNKNHDNKVLWGLRIDRRVKKSCEYVAGLMRIPASLLVSFMITWWLHNTRQSFKKRDNLKLLAAIIKAYGRKLDDKPAPPSRQPKGVEDVTFYPTTNWTIRQVSVVTRLRLRTLALNRGIPVSKVIDDLPAKEWERAGKRKEVAVPGMSGKLKRETRKLLNMPSGSGGTHKRFRYEEIQRWLATDQDPLGLQKDLRSQGFSDEEIAEARMELSREIGFRI